MKISGGLTRVVLRFRIGLKLPFHFVNYFAHVEVNGKVVYQDSELQNRLVCIAVGAFNGCYSHLFNFDL